MTSQGSCNLLSSYVDEEGPTLCVFSEEGKLCTDLHECDASPGKFTNYRLAVLKYGCWSVDLLLILGWDPPEKKVHKLSLSPNSKEALSVLWSATFPDQKLDGLISEQWKKMGWQGKDPSTDFRGAGFISLENLLFFAKTFSISFQHLIRKQGARGAAWEYPFAVAGLNITFMLVKMLDLDATKPRTLVSAVFVHLLSDFDAFSESEWAFDLLYCVAFIVMDKKWEQKNASYMEFNEVLKSTRAQLEEELLMDDVLRIEDMPSFRLLH
ncbi:ELMO domain-containing protein C isoform X2 [Tanacetum coccineum]